jgi:hypothetical protein
VHGYSAGPVLRTLPVRLNRWLAAALLLLAPRGALAGDIDDTVYLRNGGRVRGVVLEESPSVGVRIRLPDGTTRSLEAAEVHHVAYGSAVIEVRSDTGRSTVRFGVGGEPVLWYVPAGRTTELGARVFGRMNVDVSPLVAVRLDLGVGALDGIANDSVFEQESTSIPISLRADLQFNLTRHYAVGLGVDLGVDIFRESGFREPIVTGGASPDAVVGAGTTSATAMLGLHVSPITLRFGRANQFQFAAQEGILDFVEGGNPAFEQTLSFTYLFGSPAASSKD